MSIQSTATSPSTDGALPEPLDAVFACAARWSPSTALLTTFAAGLSHIAGSQSSPDDLGRLAHALRRAIEDRHLPPSRFLTLEDEITGLLVRSNADPAQVEQVLVCLEDIYIARW